MNELALFAGAGGGLLGSKLLGWRTVCAVEKAPYRREVLLRRQRDGMLDLFPIWDDIRTFDGRAWRGAVDIVTAGFPCQPFSVAGKQRGEDDERNLWPKTIRVIREVGPRFALLENVPGLLADGYFGTVLGDLAEAGYDAEWYVLGADDVGAPHRRKRVWILAYANTSARGTKFGIQQGMRAKVTRGSREGGADDVATAKDEGLQKWTRGCCREPGLAGPECDGRARITWWLTDPADVDVTAKTASGTGLRTGYAGTGGRAESGDSGARPTQPVLGRVAHGVAYRVERLGAIGDGQVPAVVRATWELLMKAHTSGPDD